MRSVVLSIATRYLLPLLAVFALFLLVRGHEEPGGGFAAALVLSAAIGFYGLADGEEAIRQLVPMPRVAVASGLIVALVAGGWPVLLGGVFFEGIWLPFEVPIIGGVQLGTPVLFDVGICLVATGAVVEILVSLLGDE